MGGWKLEIFKMGMYMSFPVGLFWYFNQPEYFEKWVIQTKQQLYPPSNRDHRNVRRFDAPLWHIDKSFSVIIMAAQPILFMDFVL